MFSIDRLYVAVTGQEDVTFVSVTALKTDPGLP